MTLALAPHVHLAALGDDVVFLDVRADVYMCVPGGRALLRPSPDGATVSPIDRGIRRGLIDAALADESRAPAHRRRVAPPTRDLGAAIAAPISWAEALRLGAALWDLARRYRGRPLDEILAFAARQSRPISDPEREAEIRRLARIFQRVAIWLPISGKCLVRSFVLLRFLQRSGLSAQWVFGVRTWPFAAHCWLQLDDMALDDHADRLAPYEPILAVG